MSKEQVITAVGWWSASASKDEDALGVAEEMRSMVIIIIVIMIMVVLLRGNPQAADNTHGGSCGRFAEKGARNA